MHSSHEPARAACRAFLLTLKADEHLRQDVSRAFDLLLSRYNTRIYENRFLVGGVTERIIAAAFVAMGNVVKNHGVEVTRTDIRVDAVHISVKGVFRPSARSVRLVNVMGESSGASWNEPTLFVISKRGIGYADPELVSGGTRRSRDAIEIPIAPLAALWERSPEYFLPLDLLYSRDDAAGSDVASRVVADEILRYTTRLRPFDLRTPAD